MANSTLHFLSKIQMQKVLTKAFTIKGIPSQISHAKYPPTVPHFSLQTNENIESKEARFVGSRTQ
jgi:hypothetical protein